MMTTRPETETLTLETYLPVSTDGQYNYNTATLGGMANLPDADEVCLGIAQPHPTIDAPTLVSGDCYYEHIHERMRRIWRLGMRWDWAVGERLARFG